MHTHTHTHTYFLHRCSPMALRLGFNPRLGHTKDSKKMVLNATLDNTQHYKVQIKGKVEQSKEKSSTLLDTLV